MLDQSITQPLVSKGIEYEKTFTFPPFTCAKNIIPEVLAQKDLSMVRTILFAIFILFVPLKLSAASFTYWAYGNINLPANPPPVNDPKSGCDYLYSDMHWSHLKNNYMPERNRYFSADQYDCAMRYEAGGFRKYFGSFIKYTITCAEGETFDFASRKCSLTAQNGDPNDPLSCKTPPPKKGNPINIATGNKYQPETDLVTGGVDPIRISRHYNSSSGLWLHSYSTHLYFIDRTVALVHSDGRETHFLASDGSYSTKTDLGTLKKEGDMWVYDSPSRERLAYFADGKLASITSPNGEVQNLVYNQGVITITNQHGQTVQLTEDLLHQPRSLTSDNLEITYTYSTLHRLSSVTKNANGSTATRLYHYEISGKPNLLTGITDERGVRYATWSYDVKGLAISSEHAGGAERVVVAYNADGSSTVTNELGKQTTYRFQLIQGVKRITAIEGQPSANCPNSNSTFTYDERGLLKTKTDNKGHLTTYSYNARGLEASRTEAAGTPQARTLTTEWHPTLNLPLTVTEPTRITTYTYDAQGRQLSQSVTPR